MKKQVNIHEAKTTFSKLVEMAEAGEEVIIARAGKPVVKLVAIEASHEPIKLGFAKALLSEWDEETWVRLDREFNQLFREKKF